MNVNTKKSVLLATLAMIVGLVGCTKKKATDEIVIGHFGSMTGNDATFGQSTDMGIRLAVDEVNAKGGIRGKKIRVVTLDTQGKSEEAASVVTRLITQEKVVALVGEVASSRSLAAAPIAQRFKIPMVTPSSTNPEVTKKGEFIFRTCFIDPFQGTVMAKFAAETLKVKKVAVLREVGSDYSVGLSNYFIQKFQQLGGEIVADVSYTNTDIDYKAQLAQIRSKNPEAIFIPGYYSQVGLIARQARELGVNVPLLGGDGWDSPKLYEIGGDAINGSYFSNHYSSESKDAATVEFIQKFKAKFNNITPDGLTASGYDATRVLLYAIANAKDTSGDQIRWALTQVREFPGATGKITIDGYRNASKTAVVVQVQRSLNRYVTSIAP